MIRRIWVPDCKINEIVGKTNATIGYKAMTA
jgi:hypothetical protein